MTAEELQAENAALRELLAAIRDAADPPKPASLDDLQSHYLECVNRADTIAIYARLDDLDGLGHEVTIASLWDRARTLREQAVRPLRYKAEVAEVTA